MYPRRPDEVLVGLGERGAVARGLGRCYGDAAQNAGGRVIHQVDDVDWCRLDVERGRLTAPGGVSLDAIMRRYVPQGWFVPVTPGTRYVTVGGAVASDIHGKNHHVDGSFGHHLHGLRLMDAEGSLQELTPQSDPPWWWATIGGMGLTGVVVEADFDLIPLQTSRCVVDTERAEDLDDVMARMADGDHRYRYSVAWIDLVATGRRLGRSVLTRGDHATMEQLPRAQRNDPLAFAPAQLLSVPRGVPTMLNRASVTAFNEWWFRRAPRIRRGEIQSLSAFFHPLDAVGHWNRLYGPRGFLQYQLLVPFGAEQALRTVVEALASSGAASFLAVLKRFGDANLAPLSFPHPGWTLTIDLPARAELVASLVRQLDDVVLEAGGRHYLAKDAHLTPDALRRGYPRLAEWQAVRHRVDPQRRWQSDLARRLDLDGIADNT
jgi:decaprenylphospho-beta-D-ribofuranose 2-oxidase